LGCIRQKAFDASLSAVLLLLCLYIYTLLSERCRRRSESQEAFVGVSVLSSDPKASAARTTADGISDLDLTGYATTLGMSIRNGVVHKEGSTLNKILMDALAKEYLRCIAALKCYQETYGPLKEKEENVAEQDSVAPQLPPRETEPPAKSDPLVTSLSQLNIAMDLVALAEGAAPTPRDPAELGGPPSPEPKRCRVATIDEESRSAAKQNSPTPAAPANTPATALKVAKETEKASGIGEEESNSSEDRSGYDDDTPTWREEAFRKAALACQPVNDHRKKEECPPPSLFGIFGREKDSL
jgi:hypothetical protein